MKKTWLVVIAALCTATAKTKEVLVDFGIAGAAPTIGGAWNAVTTAGGPLLDVSGGSSGVNAAFASACLDTSVNQGDWPGGTPVGS